MNQKKYLVKGLFVLALITVMSLGAPQNTQATSIPINAYPCSLHPGIPSKDETAECLGNVFLSVPIENTDVVLAYHSLPSSLDSFYSNKNMSGDFWGLGWRFLNDASVFFDASGSLATVVLGDGTAVVYQKNQQETYWPIDRRASKSYVQFLNGTPVRTLSDGTQMFFGNLDGAGAYHLTRQINPNGKNVLLLSRNSNGRIEKVEGFGLRTATISYSGNDKSKSITLTNQLNQSATVTLENGFLTSVYNGNGLQETFSYGEQSWKLERYTDRMKRVTTWQYDSAGALRMTVDPLKFSTSFSYGIDSVFIRTLNGTEKHTFSKGKLKKIENLDSGSYIVLERDTAGRVTKKNENGLQTTYTYPDLLSEAPTQIEFPNKLIATIKYALPSENGGLWRAIKEVVTTGANGSGRSFVVSFDYDSFSRMTMKREGRLEYTFKYVNNTTRLPSSILLNGQVLGKYTYDSTGNLTGVTDPSEMKTSFSFNDFGLPTSISNNYTNTTISYDFLGRPVSINSPGVSRKMLTYGPLGNVETEETVLNSGTSFKKTQTLELVP